MTNYTAWPPTALGPSPTFQPDQIALFPTYTQTGTPVTLPQPTQSSGVPVGNGWANSEDKTGAWVAVAGCPYPDAYNATASSLIPTALCTGSNKKRAEEQALTLKPTPIQTPGLN
jgi:glucan 1,3-beta-glucosidase